MILKGIRFDNGRNVPDDVKRMINQRVGDENVRRLGKKYNVGQR